MKEHSRKTCLRKKSSGPYFLIALRWKLLSIDFLICCIFSLSISFNHKHFIINCKACLSRVFLWFFFYSQTLLVYCETWRWLFLENIGAAFQSTGTESCSNSLKRRLRNSESNMAERMTNVLPLNVKEDCVCYFHETAFGSYSYSNSPQ